MRGLIPILKKNAGTLLAVGACAGVVASVIFTAKDAPKALKALDELPEDASKVDKAVVVAKKYIPTAVAVSGTIFCIVSGHVVSVRKQRSMAAAYALLGATFKDYRKTLISLKGEEVDKEVVENMKTVRFHSDFHQLCVDTPDQKVWWYEPISDTWIEAYEREIMDAEYHINRNFTLGGSICVDDVLEFFGIGPVPDGELRGWDMSGGYYWIDFEHPLRHDDIRGDYYEISYIFAPNTIDEYY